MYTIEESSGTSSTLSDYISFPSTYSWRCRCYFDMLFGYGCLTVDDVLCSFLLYKKYICKNFVVIRMSMFSYDSSDEDGVNDCHYSDPLKIDW